MASSHLISRFNSLKAQKEQICSIGDVLAVLEAAFQLADDAVADVVATELAFDKVLEPAADSDFYGDEGIK